MPKANLGDVEIFYETHGVGAPVLLVPGLGGVGAYWNPNVEAFSEKQYGRDLLTRMVIDRCRP